MARNIKDASNRLKALERNLGMQAVKSSFAFEAIADIFGDDKDVAIEACKNNGICIKWCSERLESGQRCWNSSGHRIDMAVDAFER